MLLPSRLTWACLLCALFAAPAQGGTLEVPAQFGTIQAAADAAQPWDAIVIAPGIYRENVVVAKSNLYLLGAGATIDGRYLGPCLVLEGDWTSASGLTLVNGGTPDAAQGTTGGGVVATGYHIDLLDLTVRACAGAGMECHGQVLIVDCLVEGCTGPGIWAEGLGSVEDNVLAVRCTLRHCRNGIAGQGGMFHVDECLIEGSREAGIDCNLDPVDWLEFSSFEYSTIVDSGGPGIRVLHLLGTPLGAYGTFRGNRLERNEVGLSFRGLKFTADHLVVRNNRGGGVDADSSSLELNSSKIRSNGRFGVRSANTFGVEPIFGGFLWNIVTGNAGDGLQLQSGSRSIEVNRIARNLGDGISLQGGDDNYFLFHNRVVHNGHDGIDNSATGTWMKANVSKGNGGADLAGAGAGSGTIAFTYKDVIGDGTGVDSLQELELDTTSDAPAPGDSLHVPSPDFGTIQAAVDAAAPGDVIVVGKGSYDETVAIHTPGITLKGAGATIDGGYAGPCLTIEADDVVVKGLRLIHGSAAAEEGAAGGLNAAGDRLRLVALRVAACSGYGVSVAGNDIELRKIRVEGCDDGMLAATVDPSGAAVTVDACRVVRCGTGFTGNAGPFVLEKNIFSGNRGDGIAIALAAGGATIPTARLVENQCLDNSGRGIALSGDAGAGSKIHENVCSGNRVGMELDLLHASVSGNTVERNREGGALLTATSCTIADNVVHDNGLIGLLVAGLVAQDGLPFGDNGIIDNELSGNAGDGLFLACNGNDVEGNSIELNLGDGLQLAAGMSGNDLRSNTLVGNGHDGLDNSATGTLIEDNVCTDNGGADLAGLGGGSGTVSPGSSGNLSGDGTGFESLQELELATF